MIGQATTVLRALVVLTRAGLVAPLGPGTLLKVGQEVARLGASIPTLVALSAARWPDRVALVDDAGELTFADLEARAKALAAGLQQEYGVGAGRGVALMCRNHRGLVEGLLAAGHLGADVVLVNTELPAPQLAATLGNRELGIVLHDAEFAGRLAEAGLEVPYLVASGEDAESGGEQLISHGGRPSGRVLRPGRLVLLTSGTTGTPKGVPREPEPLEMLGMVASCTHRMQLRVRQTWLVAPPAFHGMGLITLLLGLGCGGTVVLHRRFDAEQVVRSIEEHRVETLVAVPVMLQRMLQVPGLGRRASSLQVVLSGAAALSPGLAERFQDEVGNVLFDGYGSSEVGIATLATPADLRHSPGTVGRPVIGVSLRILGEDDREVAAGTVGRLFIKSPMVFDGYDSGGGKQVVDGYVATGDLGRVDRAGRLWIEGRADDMIVSGGENVFPAPVEDVLLRHPAIADAAVLGVPDPEFGQRLLAYVVPARPGLDVEDLKGYLRGRLTRYEVPREIVLVEELPRTATGKVLRRQLAAAAVGKA